MMSEKKTSALFRFIKWCVKIFYPKTQVEGVENMPDEPVIIVGNHCQMNGPIVGELYVRAPLELAHRAGRAFQGCIQSLRTEVRSIYTE